MNGKKKILEAALAVFSKKGFHQATMDDIACPAGTAEGTLCCTCTSKPALFRKAVADGTEAISEQARESLSFDLPLHSHLIKLVEHLCADHLKNPRPATKKKVVEYPYTLLANGLCKEKT